MSNTTKRSPLKISEYSIWVAKQKFEDPKEHHKHVPIEEQEFLQTVIYPMFYFDPCRRKYKSIVPFPLVLTDYSTRYPIYVIDNQYYTIVFFSLNTNYNSSWQISFHIKDHWFCDKRIKEFRKWYARYYCDSYRNVLKSEEMPKRFKYPALDIANEVEVEKDFCIEFKNTGRHYKMFKFFDSFRLF